MTITVAMMRVIGLTEDQIIRLLDLERAEGLADRRERNRIYQRNHRARKRSKVLRPDIADIKKRPGPFKPLPPDWRPRAEVGPSEVGKFERFSRHARDKNRKSADWEAAWENWRTSDFQSGSNSNGGHVNGGREEREREAASYRIEQFKRRSAEQLAERAAFESKHGVSGNRQDDGSKTLETRALVQRLGASLKPVLRKDDGAC